MRKDLVKVIKNTWNKYKSYITIGVLASILIFFWENSERISDLFLDKSEKFEKEIIISDEIGYSKRKSNSENDTNNGFRFILEPKDLPEPRINGIYIKGLSKESFLYLDYLGRKADLPINDGKMEHDILVSYCKDLKLFIRVENDHVYAQVEFADLLTGDIIGKMMFNKWELYKGNKFFFRNDDDRLEVLDGRRRVLFSMSYEGRKNGRCEVFIAGYFRRDSSIFIMPNDPKYMYRDNKKLCIQNTEPDWIEKAKAEIAHIKPVFDNW